MMPLVPRNRLRNDEHHIARERQTRGLTRTRPVTKQNKVSSAEVTVMQQRREGAEDAADIAREQCGDEWGASRGKVSRHAAASVKRGCHDNVTVSKVAWTSTTSRENTGDERGVSGERGTQSRRHQKARRGTNREPREAAPHSTTKRAMQQGIAQHHEVGGVTKYKLDAMTAEHRATGSVQSVKRARRHERGGAAKNWLDAKMAWYETRNMRIRDDKGNVITGTRTIEQVCLDRDAVCMPQASPPRRQFKWSMNIARERHKHGASIARPTMQGQASSPDAQTSVSCVKVGTRNTAIVARLRRREGCQ
ncbi:hypothetical protein K438DRAFT_1789438 [Mycena galopus ATCC 62051]|nr:hypothetical protein K438DRAFT_1789438 [Mycena galopus ATCC 62051]